MTGKAKDFETNQRVKHKVLVRLRNGIVKVKDTRNNILHIEWPDGTISLHAPHLLEPLVILDKSNPNSTFKRFK